jgi:hypothetical protein
MTSNHEQEPVEPVEIDDAAQEPIAEERPAARGGLGWWLGSAATHATALALMAAVYYTVAKEDEHELPPIPVTIIPEIPKPPITPPPDDQEQPVQLPEITDVLQPITQVDAPIDVPPGEEDAPVELPPAERGDERATADVALSNSPVSMFMAIGAGDGAMAKHGSKFPGRGDRGSRGPIGAPRWTSKATTSALDWFKRHQSPDGRWDAVDYWQNCTEDGVKGEPGKDQNGDTDVAMTAYAVLCFLGDGHDHRTPGRYNKVVKRGVDWLLANQKADGLLGSRNYEHAIATMVLAQAYGMSNDPALREPTQKAVDVILARQNVDAAGQAPYNRLGWDYTKASERNDASVTGWNVMALKSAMVAGLNVGGGIDGSKAWLERTWKAANTAKPWCASVDKLDPYTDITRFPYVWNTGSADVQIAEWKGDGPGKADSHDLASVGLMCAVFLGHQAGDPMLETLGNYVVKYQKPTAWPLNTYYLYYNTLGVFQLGGERWQGWAKDVLPLVRDAQRSEEGCNRGSWDWQGTKFHGHDTGRVLSTAYACLSMQVYWMYEKQIAPAKRKG